MRISILFVALTFCFIGFSGCGKHPGKGVAVTDGVDKETKEELTPAEKEAAALATAKELATKMAKESKAKLASLVSSIENGETPENLGADLLALAEKFPETPAAAEALQLAVQHSTGEQKENAMESFLKTVLANPNADEAKEGFRHLVEFGSGKFKTSALTGMLSIASRDLESDESFELLKEVIQTEEDSAPKDGALQMLKEFITKDIKSDKAAESLALIYNRSKSQNSRDSALQNLLDHHINHERMMELTTSLAGGVSESNELLIKEVYEKASGPAKGNAIIAMSRFFQNRVAEVEKIKGLSEAEQKALEPGLVTYLQSERNPDELENLKGMLQAYVKAQTPIVDLAKKELEALASVAAVEEKPAEEVEEKATVKETVEEKVVEEEPIEEQAVEEEDEEEAVKKTE